MNAVLDRRNSKHRDLLAAIDAMAARTVIAHPMNGATMPALRQAITRQFGCGEDGRVFRCHEHAGALYVARLA